MIKDLKETCSPMFSRFYVTKTFLCNFDLSWPPEQIPINRTKSKWLAGKTRNLHDKKEYKENEGQ